MIVNDPGTQPGTPHFNGIQTSGRTYRNLSAAEHAIRRDLDQQVPLRAGGHLLADVYRPQAAGRFPVLIAASPTRGRSRTWALPRGSSRQATASSSSPAGTST